MRTRRSRLLTAVLLLFLFLVFVSTTAAESDLSQTLELTVQNNKTVLQYIEPVTLWESPTLKAGETLIENGTLTLLNNTDEVHSVELKEVQLPYDNETMLRYLYHLHLTVSDPEGNLLYDGPYSRINSFQWRLVIYAELAPHEQKTFQLRLSCDYSVSEPTGLNGKAIIWDFRLADPAVIAPEDTSFTDFNILLFFWGILFAAVFLIFFLFLRFRKYRHHH